jgi:hypothetical protein
MFITKLNDKGMQPGCKDGWIEGLIKKNCNTVIEPYYSYELEV